MHHVYEPLGLNDSEFGDGLALHILLLADENKSEHDADDDANDTDDDGCDEKVAGALRVASRRLQVTCRLGIFTLVGFKDSAASDTPTAEEARHYVCDHVVVDLVHLILGVNYDSVGLHHLHTLLSLHGSSRRVCTTLGRVCTTLWRVCTTLWWRVGTTLRWRVCTSLGWWWVVPLWGRGSTRDWLVATLLLRWRIVTLGRWLPRWKT